MAAARGDRKPCTRNGCSGTMQFGREPVSHGPTAGASDGERGWICSARTDHFQREFEQSGAARAGWQDDGGS